jgi:hypothetical protein
MDNPRYSHSFIVGLMILYYKGLSTIGSAVSDKRKNRNKLTARIKATSKKFMDVNVVLRGFFSDPCSRFGHSDAIMT